MQECLEQERLDDHRIDQLPGQGCPHIRTEEIGTARIPRLLVRKYCTVYKSTWYHLRGVGPEHLAPPTSNATAGAMSLLPPRSWMLGEGNILRRQPWMVRYCNVQFSSGFSCRPQPRCDFQHTSFSAKYSTSLRTCRTPRRNPNPT